MTKTRSNLPPDLLAALQEATNTSFDLNANKAAEPKLTLKELVKATEVSERTIRYYIQEGILPPPQGAGPASRYGLEHLTRLSLVRRFKALLPLSKIKELMSELAPGELEKVADQLYSELTHTNPVPLPAEERTEIREVQPSGLKKPRPIPANWSWPRADADVEVFRLPEDEVTAAHSQDEQGLIEPPAELDSLTFAGRWNRIALAPGLELHYQEGGPQDTGAGREQVARLVELAMRIYR